MKRYFRVLTIAGSDSGGGAGIQADIKTITALGCYGMSVITALTAQNTLGVDAVEGVSAGFVEKQMDSVLNDIGADAVKIGMLHSIEIIEQVAVSLKKHSVSRIVLDPVMVAKSGDMLIREDARDALKRHLLGMALVVTPNVMEASILSDTGISTDGDMENAARKIGSMGPASVLVKGGAMRGDRSRDCLFTGGAEGNGRVVWFDSERVKTENLHGTGCTYSAAIASFLAKGVGIEDAIARAKEYTSGAIRASASYSLGNGRGPVDHFYRSRQNGRI